MRPDASERVFEDGLLALAAILDWRRHAERPAYSRDGEAVLTAVKGDVGWPDVTLVHVTKGIIVAELKSAKGTLGPGQREWIEALAAHEAANPDLLVEVWRPADWAAVEYALTEGVRAYRKKYRGGVDEPVAPRPTVGRVGNQ